MIISQVLGVGQGSSFRFRELRIRARFTPRLAIGKVSLLLCNLHVAGFRRGQFGVAAVVPAVPAIREFRSCSANSASYLRWGELRRVA